MYDTRLEVYQLGSTILYSWNNSSFTINSKDLKILIKIRFQMENITNLCHEYLGIYVMSCTR